VKFSINRERLPLAASLIVLGFGAAATGLRLDEGLYLTVAGAAVIGIGILTLFSQGAANQIRSFDIDRTAIPRMPEGVEAKVAWSGDGPPPEDLRNALTRMGVTLENESTPRGAPTRVFTARLGPKGLMTNEDDLRERGTPATAVVKSAKRLGMELGDRTLVELILEVHLPDQDPYTVKDLSMPPNSQLITIGAGLAVPVLVDPKDPVRLMIDWDRG
jgi:hypothetical protein